MIADIIVISLIVIALAFIVFYYVRKKKRGQGGGCGCGCSSCGAKGSCHKINGKVGFVLAQLFVLGLDE